ncbi:MAG: hypothetical protein ACYCUM_13975, partial [Solirubrobacteraceae bacterium]
EEDEEGRDEREKEGDEGRGERVADIDPARAAGAVATRSTDVDGARLIALNMALNGDSREQTERYLAVHFDLAERATLVEEVFAAIDG